MDVLTKVARVPSIGKFEIRSAPGTTGSSFHPLISLTLTEGTAIHWTAEIKCGCRNNRDRMEEGSRGPIKECGETILRGHSSN
jgi:hypothetical protein